MTEHAHGHDETKRVTTDRGWFEVSIFEEGVPPRFRIQFFDKEGKAIAPGAHNVVTIETEREGGARQTFAFANRNSEYLEAEDALPEPHEFKALVSMAHGEHAHTYALVFVEHSHGHDHAAVAEQDHGHTHSADDRGHAHAAVAEQDHAHSHAVDDHGHGGHTHGPEADHGHGNAFMEAMHHLMPWLPGGHSHTHAAANVDSALETNTEGIRAVKQSLVVLAITSVLQLWVVIMTGSVALLADMIHNFGDALTAVPLWIAFSLTRRAPSGRFTYGLGRSEDLAGVAIVLIIFFSAAVALYEAVERIINPQTINGVGAVFAAGLLGFLGNEIASVIRLRTGRRIGSAALVADGQHALVDGYTSLAVAVGAAGVFFGFPLADPLMGILISVAILFIVKDSAIAVFRRIMDGIEPETVSEIRRVAGAVPGVQLVDSVRARWHGHTISVDMLVTVDEDLSLRDAHAIQEKVRREIFHEVGRIGSIMIHADPTSRDGVDHHRSTAHHEPTLYPKR